MQLSISVMQLSISLMELSISVTTICFSVLHIKLNAWQKTLGASEKLEDFETHFRIKWCFLKTRNIHSTFYGVPH
jgi:hypothetical protein